MATLDFERPVVELQGKIQELRQYAQVDGSMELQLRQLEEQVTKLQVEVYSKLSVWQRVQLSRHPDRPYFLDYIERIFTDFVELHGDRAYSDDAAIVAGFATFEGQSVAIIGQQKGRTTKEKLKRNFGMAHPDGYRKAMRVMQLAERYRRPVLTFIDTPGAYPGIGAEERGQSEAIGQSLLVMSGLTVPVIATVIGEGGSGGALALGVANRVLMMEYATYSVITPEGCASILFRDGARAPEAAGHLKLLSTDAFRLGVIDGIVTEPVGGAHRDFDQAAQGISQELAQVLGEIHLWEPERLKTQRFEKFRTLGEVAQGPS